MFGHVTPFELLVFIYPFSYTCNLFFCSLTFQKCGGLNLVSVESFTLVLLFIVRPALSQHWTHFKISCNFSVPQSEMFFVFCNSLSCRHVFQSKYMWGQQQILPLRIPGFGGSLCSLCPRNWTCCSRDRHDRLDCDPWRTQHGDIADVLRQLYFNHFNPYWSWTRPHQVHVCGAGAGRSRDRHVAVVHLPRLEEKESNFQKKQPASDSGGPLSAGRTGGAVSDELYNSRRFN